MLSVRDPLHIESNPASHLCREFNDDIGMVAVENMVAIMPDEWKPDMLSSSLLFRGVSHFHKPGIVYAAELIVALPNRK